jgi:GTP pyrophosphokinase
MNSTASTSIPRFSEIQDLVKSYYADADLDLIRSAYVYSAQVHRGQTRRGGEPYLIHPVAVARILAQMKLDEATVATGLLHDTVEDTLATIEDINEFFGQEIATLVDGVTKISKIEFQSKEERQAESFRKMILAMSRDIRVLLIKLADRLHNMRTLDPMPPEAQRRISQETIDIYAPLAGRLGIYWMRTQLEDLAFRYLQRDTFQDIKAKLEESVKRTEQYVANVIQIMNEKLNQYKIKGTIKGRHKDIYSIHQKMVIQNLDFEQVHDLTAFRVIVDNVSECYAVLGIIHSLWRPVPGRFKDYVAMPKGNGYQSLHTTVIGPDGNRIEIQIRTNEMDLVAEEGIAAHWSYKEGRSLDAKDAQVISWLRQMMEWQNDLEDPREFFESVRVDLYPNDVYVFTPQGDVKEFPKGATPLDFAYSIHTEVGHRCIGAKIGGKMVPLKYELKTGDAVEIVTSVHQKPSKDWLKFVKTARARAKIRHFILAEEREHAIEMGREQAERELRKWRIDLAHSEKTGLILNVSREFSFKGEIDLYAAIGYGKISPKALVTRLVPPQERERAREALKAEKLVKKERSSAKSGVRVEGLADIMVNFARCCSPLPGDPIRGYITRGRGVTVHKQDCQNLFTIDAKRIVGVSWDAEQPLKRTVSLGVRAFNRTGLLALISGVFSSNDADIFQANVKTVDGEQAFGTFTISVRNLDHLNQIMNALKQVKGVQTVERLAT